MTWLGLTVYVVGSDLSGGLTVRPGNGTIVLLNAGKCIGLLYGRPGGERRRND